MQWALRATGTTPAIMHTLCHYTVTLIHCKVYTLTIPLHEHCQPIPGNTV